MRDDKSAENYETETLKKIQKLLPHSMMKAKNRCISNTFSKGCFLADN